jgi:AraC family transcriptional regulator
MRLLSSRRAGIIRVEQEGRDFSDAPSDVYLLTAPLRGSPFVDCQYGGYTLRDQTHPGDFVLQPLQQGAVGWADRPVQIQMMALEGAWFRQLFSETASTSGLDLEMLSVNSWRDPFLSNLIERIWNKIGAERDASQAWVDAAVMLMVKTLAEKTCSTVPVGQRVKRLSQVQMTRVYEFVAANLAEPLGIAELAGIANLSPYYFARAFKQTRGQTPHQYIVMCRINRARELLAATKMTLSEIAYVTGFSSQAHMTTRFREAMGLTPGALRRVR